MNLRRFLNDEPIHARPLTRPERAWRWCRRKPALAASLCAILILTLAMCIGAPIAAYRINQARRAEQMESLKAQHYLYAADMIVAQQALEFNNVGHARSLLERHRPTGKPEAQNPKSESRLSARSSTINSQLSTDLRGWEWHYLWEQSAGDELSRLGPCPLGAHSVVPSPDGKLLATKLADEETYQVWDLTTRRLLGSYSNTIGTPFSFSAHYCAFSPDRIGARIVGPEGTPLQRGLGVLLTGRPNASVRQRI